MPNWWKLPCVDEAVRGRWRVCRPTRGTAKRPVARVPQTPDMPCTATAPIGSSILIFSTRMTPKTAMKPEPTPITIAAQGATNPEAAVIATRAPRVPLSIIEMSGLPSLAPGDAHAGDRAGGGGDVGGQRDVGEVAEATEIDGEGWSRG